MQLKIILYSLYVVIKNVSIFNKLKLKISSTVINTHIIKRLQFVAKVGNSENKIKSSQESESNNK